MQAEEWISTAQQQADKTIQLIEQSAIEETALLNQKYGEQANMQNEAYATEYNNIIAQKEAKIQEANAEVAEITKAYANGYWQRSEDNQKFLQLLNEAHRMEVESGREHSKIMDEVYEELYKDMSDWEAEQLGVWLAQVANAELYGAELDEETKKTVDTILDTYDRMPEKTRETMKNAMSPMLEEMESSEPTLFAKASGIADGILSRLKTSFDIHSPSRETRKIFENVMKGAEIGLNDEEKNLYSKVNEIANKMKIKLADITPNMGAIKQSVIDQTKTVFTTPTLNIYAQDELTPAKINTIIDTVNNRLGSKY